MGKIGVVCGYLIIDLLKMGLDGADLLDDGDSAGVGGGGEGKGSAAVSCSICLEVVSDNGDRSWAKLQCGHQFHLGKRVSYFG